MEKFDQINLYIEETLRYNFDQVKQYVGVAIFNLSGKIADLLGD